MRFHRDRGLGCLAVHAGAALAIGAVCLSLDEYRELTAAQMLKRVGGTYLMESFLGRSVIVEAKFFGASPSAEDLAALVPLRALQVVDLSFSQIGDRELAALVSCRARIIIVPEGCTSRRVRQQFAEGRLVIGYGRSRPRNPAVNNRVMPYTEEECEGFDQKTVACDGDLERSPKPLSSRDEVRTSCFEDNSFSGHNFAARAGRRG